MSLTSEEIGNLATQGYENPAWFCRFFLNHWFPTPMPWVHYGIIAILTRRTDFLLKFHFSVHGQQEHYSPRELEKIIQNFTWKAEPTDPDSPEHPIFIPVRDAEGNILSVDLVVGKFTLIMMPRGFSKTTLMNAINVWKIAYQVCKFPVYISKTGKHATKQLSSVTKQFSNNNLFRAVFGELKPAQRNDEGLRWSESEGYIQTTTNVSMMAVGSGGQIRGSLDDGQRPDNLTIDDIEDKENTKTDERRVSNRDWFFSDMLPVLPELDPEATATMLCNLVHNDSIGVHLMEDPQWTVIKFGPLDKEGKPLWPELMDEEKLEIKKQSYALQGQLANFYLEYFNEVRNIDESKFRPDFFIYIPRIISDLIRKSIALDPAISKSLRADDAAIALGGITTDGRIHVMDMWGKRGAEPQELVATYFEMAKQYGMSSADLFGVETVAFQASIVSYLREAMVRENYYFEIVKHNPGEDKVVRIEGVLQPRYANGFISHQRRFPKLESQLLDWPYGKRDWPDALAMMIAQLQPDLPLVAVANGQDLAADSYPPLEEIFEGDWRSY